MDLKNLTRQLKVGPVRSRVLAARRMRKIEAPKRVAAKALLRAVETDEVAEVRSAAVISLGILKEPVSIRPVAEALAQDRLDGGTAVKTLQAFGDRSFGPLAAAQWDPRYRDQLHWLTEAGKAISEQRLLRALQSKDPRARAYAAILLGKRSSRKALPLLTKLLKDPSEQVRSSAAEAIAQIESKTRSLPESILLAQLASHDWRVREAVLKTLPNMDFHLAWPSVTKYVTDPDFRVRAAAAATIDDLIHRWPTYRLEFARKPKLVVGLDRLAANLAEKLRETETPDNYGMAKALVGVRSSKTARVIVRCLGSDHAQLRAAMAEALREGIAETNTNQKGSWLQIGKRSDGSLHIDSQTQGVALKLVRVARDTHPGVRKVAVAALEKMKEKIVEAESGYAPSVQPGTKAVAHPEKVVEAIDKALQEAKPAAPRYADASFYDGGKQEQHRVPDTSPLVEDKWYFFEVAARMKRVGVRVGGQGDRPFREPRQQGPVKLLVTLEAAGFDMRDAVQELTLPPYNDSTENAWFEVRPQRRSTDLQDLAKIRVRMFYKYNLLEVFTIEAEIAGRLDDPAQSRFGPRWLNQESLQREYTDLDDVVARSMHIEVRRPGPDYQLTFTLGVEPGPKLALTATTRLKATDLEDALKRFRRKFESLATSKTYLQGVKGKLGEFQNALYELAKMGRGLRTSLFSAKPGSALDVIGQHLQQQPLPVGSMIQVSVQGEAGDFLFPWSLLYDRTVPDAAYNTDANGFWGLRYPIEQLVANIRAETDAPREVDGALRLLFMLWENFRNTKSQLAMMDSLKKRAGEKLEISEPPVTSRDHFYRTAGEEAHILYFYTHGHTRRRLDSTDPTAGIQEWVARYKELPKETRKWFKSIYDSIVSKQYEADSSWIGLSDCTLHLEEMRDHIRFLPGRPLVILNMCESAQVTPTLADSFVEFFLDRNACAVIGTECPMTVEFAHPFAQRFLEGILAGKRVGDVLVEARRHFLTEERNPLGLAYTLFGSAATMFVPPRLPETNNERPNT